MVRACASRSNGRPRRAIRAITGTAALASRIGLVLALAQLPPHGAPGAVGDRGIGRGVGQLGVAQVRCGPVGGLQVLGQASSPGPARRRTSARRPGHRQDPRTRARHRRAAERLSCTVSTVSAGSTPWASQHLQVEQRIVDQYFAVQGLAHQLYGPAQTSRRRSWSCASGRRPAAAAGRPGAGRAPSCPSALAGAGRGGRPGYRQPGRLARVLGPRHGLGVGADHGRQLGDHLGGAHGVGDQLRLDVERVEDLLRVRLGRVGQPLLDLRPELFEQLRSGGDSVSRPCQIISVPDQRQRTPSSAAATIAASQLVLPCAADLGGDRGRERASAGPRPLAALALLPADRQVCVFTPHPGILRRAERAVFRLSRAIPHRSTTLLAEHEAPVGDDWAFPAHDCFPRRMRDLLTGGGAGSGGSGSGSSPLPTYPSRARSALKSASGASGAT